MPRKSSPGPDPFDHVTIMARLRRLSPEQLFKRFLQCEGDHARSLFEAACCVEVMQDHPAYFSRIPLAATYLRIASGKIDPAAYLTFIDSPACEPISRLPVPVQKELARKPEVVVVDPATRKPRKASLDKLDRKTANQVLGPYGPRSEAKQNEYLDSLPPPKPRDEDRGHAVTVHFKTGELYAIQEVAKALHTSVSKLLWQLANDAGYLQPPAPERPKPRKAANQTRPRPPQ